MIQKFFDPEVITKLGISAAILIAGIILIFLLKSFVSRMFPAEGPLRKSSLFIKKITSNGGIAILFFIILSVWIKNPFSFLMGFLGLVAIGFFAVWSLLSNVFAGILILLTRPFTVDDQIEILPDGIKGRVVDFDIIFLRLQDDEGSVFNIPHNMVFQRFIKRERRK